MPNLHIKISDKTVNIFPQNIFKTLSATPSKSVMQRYIAAAILSEKSSTFTGISYCDDCKTAVNIAKTLGAEVLTEEKKIILTPGKYPVKNEINCGESGLAIRMFTPVISLFGNNFLIKGEGSLKKRPVKGIADALIQAGIDCKTNNGFVPVSVSGKLKGGNIEINGSESSQVLTGLLFALPKAEKDSVIKVKNLKSKPYIDLTISVLKKFGIKTENNNYKEFYIKGNQKYKAQKLHIEGDWSSAAFMLVAGLIAGEVKLKGLNLLSEQADKMIINAVQAAGGKISVKENEIICKKSKLNAFQFDATNCPDLFPPLVAMAAYAEGTSLIKGVNRLKHKESNRAEVLKKEFKKVGINIITDKDLMLIEGGNVKGGKINSHNDHRIAMAASIIALGSKKGIKIKNAFCVNKSYPEFYNDLFYPEKH